MATKWHEEETPPARYWGQRKNKKLVNKVKNWQNDAEKLVSTWRSNQNKWHKLRMRVKKKKNFPFPGCSNIRLPTLDTVIRKVKAGLNKIIFGIRPIVQVVPSPSGNWETARKIEKFLDHLIMDVMDVKEKSIIAIDRMLEKGFFLMKPFWKTEITTRVEEYSIEDLSLKEALMLYSLKNTDKNYEKMLVNFFDIDTHPLVYKDNKKEIDDAIEKIKSGEFKIKMELQDLIYNFPEVDLADPEKVYVPTTTGYNPQDARYIIHEFFLPLSQVEQRVEHKGWDKEALEILKRKQKTNLDKTESELTKEEREGIQSLQSTDQLLKVWETYCWYDINNDGSPEKCLITIAPDFDLVLREITIPSDSGDYPFIKLYYELIDDRWFSHRGLPELLEDIVKEIDVQHMQRIDSQTLRNAPMFLYRAGMVNPKMTQFVFGQGIPVQGMQPLEDTIRPFDASNPQAEQSYKDEQMMLETKIQELTGRINFTLQSMINRRQPRSAQEVSSQQQSAHTVFSLDSDTFRGCMENLFRKIWELWNQYGDDKYEFRYFGDKNNPRESETINLSKDEIQGKYKITIRGNDQNTNPKVRLQKAQMILQDTYQALQAGSATLEEVNNARKRFYKALGVSNMDELTLDKKKMQQIMKQQQQSKQSETQLELTDDLQPKWEKLTDMEQAQILMKYFGIKPDFDGRQLDKLQEMREKSAEIEMKQEMYEERKKKGE